MERKIARSTLPQWAQDALAKASSTDFSSISRDGETLSIIGPTALYNGMLIVEEVTEPQPETITFETLPFAVQRRISSIAQGSVLYESTNGIHLEVRADGTTLYNGMRVLRAGEEHGKSTGTC